MRGREIETLEKSIPLWEQKAGRLAELTKWCHEAARQLERENATPGDPRWEVYGKYENEAKRLEKEIEQIEETQEAAVAAIVKERGPIVLEMEDGSTRTLASSPGDRGDGEPLLPRDFLAVWRVAKVFEGSVVMGGVPTKLAFGDTGQISSVRLSAKEKKPKKGAFTGEEGRLFEG
jgi:hypothetical protein